MERHLETRNRRAAFVTTWGLILPCFFAWPAVSFAGSACPEKLIKQLPDKKYSAQTTSHWSLILQAAGGTQDCADALSGVVNETLAPYRLNAWVFVLPSQAPLFYPLGQDGFVISEGLLAHLTSEAMLLGLVLYGVEIQSYLPDLPSGKWVSNQTEALNFWQIIQGWRPPVHRQRTIDESVAKSLGKAQIHPGGWYSVLRAVNLAQPTDERWSPLRLQWGPDITHRLNVYQRYLDRHGFSKSSVRVGTEPYQQRLQQAGLRFKP